MRASGLSALDNCHNFTIQGGTFNVGTPTEQPQSDFRFVNLGDLIFLDEIDTQNVTLLIKRKAEVLEIQRYRHPLLAQLFGFSCSSGLDALIYYDDMVTICQIRRIHGQSALASHYVPYEMSRHFKAAELYWKETTGKSFSDLPGTAWIRMSTGKLCLNIGVGFEQCWSIQSALQRSTQAKLPSLKLTENELHAKLLCALKLDEFHDMFTFSYRIYFSYGLPSSTKSITLPSIWIPSDCVDFKPGQMLTLRFPNHLTSNDIHMCSWTGFGLRHEVMLTGWTRVEYQGSHEHLYLGLMSVRLRLRREGNVMNWWLSQQNCVRKHLQNDLADVPLRLITGISFLCKLDPQLDNFTLRGTFMTGVPSDPVYLFLFSPQVEILDGQLTVINPADAEKYYWAFDPAGLHQLTNEVAENIGLPTPEFSIELSGPTFAQYEDAMIREFHAAKGFDPDSQDATIAMGYPLVDIEAMKRSAREASPHSTILLHTS
ncbi:hypothetical protein MVEN_01886900 [Mycena venus]|uniref:Uncharacterized protein n=1 Tax=Mycena venus TaxID=2733690 RepID=A0A8H6XJJ1_9AGAR|nr:hypothetical protein MVEN_01886900 [Mycena venus]